MSNDALSRDMLGDVHEELVGSLRRKIDKTIADALASVGLDPALDFEEIRKTCHVEQTGLGMSYYHNDKLLLTLCNVTFDTEVKDGGQTFLVGVVNFLEHWKADQEK